MQTPIYVCGKGVDLTPEHEATIRDEVSRLEHFFGRLVACRAVVTVPNRRLGRDPIAWSVRLALTVPGGELAVSRQAKASFREALEDTFAAARRQLQDCTRTMRGDVKCRAEGPRGIVTRLYGYEGYGFLMADDGREVYFHRNAVVDDGFDQLTIGDPVRFVEVEGEKGPQASTVVLATGVVEAS